jgi:hypothetical protein
MPLLTATDPPRKHRAPAWLWALLAVPGIILVLLVGLVAWTWDHPVSFRVGDRWVRMWRFPADTAPFGPGIPTEWRTLTIQNYQFPIPGDPQASCYCIDVASRLR